MNLRRFIIFLLAMTVAVSGLSALKLTDKTRFVIADVGLRMRDAPELGANKLGVIPFNQPVTLLEESGEEQTIAGATGKWSKVDWKGKVGWVFGGFLVKEFVMPEKVVFPSNIEEILNRGEEWLEVPYGKYRFFRFGRETSCGYLETEAVYKGYFSFDEKSRQIWIIGEGENPDGSYFRFERIFTVLYVTEELLIVRDENSHRDEIRGTTIKFMRVDSLY